MLFFDGGLLNRKIGGSFLTGLRFQVGNCYSYDYTKNQVETRNARKLKQCR